MGEIGAFAAAVWHYWLLLVGGSVVVIVLGVVEKLWRKELNGKLYLALLALLLLTACFEAWRDAYRKVGDDASALQKAWAQREVDSLQVDSLRATAARMQTSQRLQAEPPIMAAEVEGGRWTWRQVPSRVDSLPYAIEV